MEILQRHFDIALETPKGIDKLREIILSLAMQGKLVNQDLKDRPASELLEEILAEKTELVSKRKIKRQGILSPIKSSEIPYEIPSTWKWVKLEDISTLITDGAHHTPKYISAGVPFLSVKDLSSGRIDFENTKYISEEQHNELTKRCNPELNDILLTKIGTTGIAVVINTEKPFSIFVSVALIKFIHEKIFPPFLEKLINSPLVRKYSKDGTEGVGNKNLVLRKIREFIIPLPPLNEQKRIVSKIESLMSLCDNLEMQRDQCNRLRLNIHTAAIKRLTEPSNEENFASGLTFVDSQFSSLYSVVENVQELSTAIIQLGIQGKLVRQESSDKPARLLLEEIEKERNRLIEEKQIRKQDLLPRIKKDEIKYDLPMGWEWVRLIDFGVWRSGSTPIRTNQLFYGGTIPWVKSGEVKQGRIYETSETITEIALKKCSLTLNPKGSVLIAMYGANIGEVGILEIEATTNQAVCACMTYSQIDNKFLYYLLLSLKSNFISQGAGAAQPNISRDKIIRTLAPLPPFEEQKRIVLGIEELIKECKNVESLIKESTKKKSEILEAVLAKI